MYRTNKGITLTGVIALLIVLGMVAAFFPALSWASEKAKQSKCKANLSQFGKGYSLYLLDIGNQTLYPQKNGQGFIVALYNSGILVEPEVYGCPSTEDHFPETEEWDRKFASFPDEGDAEGPVSYAGRKNAKQGVYPGIFKPKEELVTTPIASDDLGESHNHENGQIVSFLFLDGHTDHERSQSPSTYSDISELINVLAN